MTQKNTKKTEWNLSEKMELCLKFKGKKLHPVLDSKDVKEFIKRVKEELCNDFGIEDGGSCGVVESVIDKLAGDKLK